MKKINVVKCKQMRNNNIFMFQIDGFIDLDQKNTIKNNAKKQGFFSEFEEYTISTFLTLSRIF